MKQNWIFVFPFVFVNCYAMHSMINNTKCDKDSEPTNEHDSLIQSFARRNELRRIRIIFNHFGHEMASSVKEQRNTINLWCVPITSTGRAATAATTWIGRQFNNELVFCIAFHVMTPNSVMNIWWLWCVCVCVSATAKISSRRMFCIVDCSFVYFIVFISKCFLVCARTFYLLSFSLPLLLWLVVGESVVLLIAETCDLPNDWWMFWLIFVYI